jgi:SH3-like domain-containing protein
MTALFIRFLPAIVLLAITPAAFGQADAQAEVREVSRFSGKVLPRFESLRYSAVHGRQGPHLDHEILWRYERARLPMLIVRETHGWRRVRDPDGDEVWMQARMLSNDRTVVTTMDVELRRKPEAGARAKAKLKANVIAELQTCENGWCKVEIDRKSGWVPEASLWGVELATGNL